MSSSEVITWTPVLVGGSEHQGDLSVSVTVCGGTGHVSQDAWFASLIPGGWRLAAIDGMTPHPDADSFAGCDAGLWAASVVAAALRAPGTMQECLDRANSQLHDPAVTPARRQAQACVVAAEVTTGAGGLAGTIVSAGDCEAWVRRGDVIARIAGGDNLLPHSRSAWKAALADRPAWEHIDLEVQYLDGPEHRRTDVPGRYVHLRTETVAFDGVEELILATDGACLGEWSKAQEQGKVCSLTNWLEGVAERSSRDDFTVLRARTAPSI